VSGEVLVRVGNRKIIEVIRLNPIFGSSEENHLPNFRKSDVIDDVTMKSWVGDDVTCQTPIFFSGYSYSRSIAYCGYPTCFNLHNTHQKIIAKLYFFTLRSKTIDKQ